MKRMQGVIVFFLILALAVVLFVIRLPNANQGSISHAQVALPPLATPKADNISQNGASVNPLSSTDAEPEAGYVIELAPDPNLPEPPGEAFYASELDISDDSQESSPGEAPADGWNPPPLAVPLARHPNDHYWFVRPVTSNYVNAGLDWYSYGSNGPGDDLRTHHGIDMANPIGVEIHAAGDGTVIWAGRGHVNEYESIPSYGNCVVIEQDLGYRGKTIYTLYAHLSTTLVQKGDRVEAGQVIGLIGATGQVTGPHVHFEVRIDRDSYYAVRNPDLWIAPYAGSGVVAGHLAFEDGSPANDVEITVRDVETGEDVSRAWTYADYSVNSDDIWRENFVVPNVPVGRYLVFASYGSTRWAAEVTVLEGLTNWADMELR